MKQNQQAVTTQTRLITLQDFFFKASKQVTLPRKTQSTNVSANSSFHDLNLCNINEIDNVLKNRQIKPKEKECQTRQKTIAEQSKHRSRQMSQPTFKITEIAKDLQTENYELPQIGFGQLKIQDLGQTYLKTQSHGIPSTLKKTGNVLHKRMRKEYNFNKISAIRHVQFVYDAKQLERVFVKQVNEFEKHRAKEYVNKDVIIEDTKRVISKKHTLANICNELNNKRVLADQIIDKIKEEYQIL